MRLKISRTPETLVQLMEDVESEEEMTENKDEEILEEELDGVREELHKYKASGAVLPEESNKKVMSV